MTLDIQHRLPQHASDANTNWQPDDENTIEFQEFADIQIIHKSQNGNAQRVQGCQCDPQIIQITLWRSVSADGLT